MINLETFPPLSIDGNDELSVREIKGLNSLHMCVQIRWRCPEQFWHICKHEQAELGSIHLVARAPIEARYQGCGTAATAVWGWWPGQVRQAVSSQFCSKALSTAWKWTLFQSCLTGTHILGKMHKNCLVHPSNLQCVEHPKCFVRCLNMLFLETNALILACVSAAIT